MGDGFQPLLAQTGVLDHKKGQSGGWFGDGSRGGGGDGGGEDWIMVFGGGCE